MSDATITGGLTPGRKVRVVQRIVGRAGVWETTVEGEILGRTDEPTGSWFAHGRDGRLWLPRLRLKKADGEITSIVLDGNSVVEVLA